jgi:hypothetical protein
MFSKVSLKSTRIANYHKFVNSQILILALVVLYAQAAPQYGHATSYATVSQHTQHQQIQGVVQATLPVALHTQLTHAAPVLVQSGHKVVDYHVSTIRFLSNCCLLVCSGSC